MYLMYLILLLISSILIIVNLSISKKTFLDREKSSPFECGFDSISSARMPFSLQFFIITIIFVIFDVEIAILIPLLAMMKLTYLNHLILIISFLIILLMGIFYEWMSNSLNWLN